MKELAQSEHKGSLSDQRQEPQAVPVIKLKKKLDQRDRKLKELRKETRKLLNELDTAYKEIRRTQEELILKGKLNIVGGFASGIGHEIKDSLNFIAMSVQHIQSKFSSSDERREFTQAVLDKVKMLNSVAAELIRFARPHESIFQKTDIHELLDSVLNLAKFKCVLQNVKVIRRFDSDLPLVMIDGGLIEQVILNLIDNSLWAMPEGGTLIIVTQVSDRKDFFEIHISDTGRGISKSNFSRIFDPFFSQKENGTGLGLPIVKRIVEEHRGFVRVKSQLNRGTTLIITLPIIQRKRQKKESLRANRNHLC